MAGQHMAVRQSVCAIYSWSSNRMYDLHDTPTTTSDDQDTSKHPMQAMKYSVAWQKPCKQQWEC